MGDGNLDVRVYFQDTDAGGIVFHAAYLNFFERARTEWLREMGVTQNILKNVYDMLIIVRKINVRYLRPGFLDDLLTVRTSLCEMRRAQITVSQTIFRDNEELIWGRINLAFVSVKHRRPKLMPNILREQFNSFCNC
tara:strand:+ start:159 stop:569 length:411 start_codon:yes stop_codon:yes gene_type:complete